MSGIENVLTRVEKAEFIINGEPAKCSHISDAIATDGTWEGFEAGDDEEVFELACKEKCSNINKSYYGYECPRDILTCECVIIIEEAYRKIELGDSAETIESKLGKPNRKFVGEGGEDWFYYDVRRTYKDNKTGRTEYYKLLIFIKDNKALAKSLLNETDYLQEIY